MRYSLEDLWTTGWSSSTVCESLNISPAISLRCVSITHHLYSSRRIHAIHWEARSYGFTLLSGQNEARSEERAFAITLTPNEGSRNHQTRRWAQITSGATLQIVESYQGQERKKIKGQVIRSARPANTLAQKSMSDLGKIPESEGHKSVEDVEYKGPDLKKLRDAIRTGIPYEDAIWVVKSAWIVTVQVAMFNNYSNRSDGTKIGKAFEVLGNPLGIKNFNVYEKKAAKELADEAPTPGRVLSAIVDYALAVAFSVVSAGSQLIVHPVFVGVLGGTLAQVKSVRQKWRAKYGSRMTTTWLDEKQDSVDKLIVDAVHLSRARPYLAGRRSLSLSSTTFGETLNFAAQATSPYADVEERKNKMK